MQLCFFFSFLPLTALNCLVPTDTQTLLHTLTHAHTHSHTHVACRVAPSKWRCNVQRGVASIDTCNAGGISLARSLRAKVPVASCQLPVARCKLQVGCATETSSSLSSAPHLPHLLHLHDEDADDERREQLALHFPPKVQ